MGYTTKFTGCINLSRALTLKEAKELLEIADLDRAEAREITGTDAYLQWVPTETLDGIVWDGNEKFYEYVPLLRWLCGWLKERGIEANGELLWAGDETDDRGRIAVSSNEVEVIKGQRIETKFGRPLTLERLGEIALHQAGPAAPHARAEAAHAGTPAQGVRMNATTYDDADVIPGAQPRLMCVACEKQEVGIYEPVCPECRKSLEQAGILKPAGEPVHIGPLDT